MVMAEARAELTALLAGEPTKRTWASITPDRVALAKNSPENEMALISWMHGVLLAAAGATELRGVVELSDAEVARLEVIDARLAAIRDESEASKDDADRLLELARERTDLDEEKKAVGTPLAASFEAFELLFAEVTAESAFKLQAYKLEQIWSAEKNV